MKQNAEAVLLLGSNLGSREANLAHAIQQLNGLYGKVVKQSALYATAPWGNIHQPDFINMAVILETRLNPDSLLNSSKSIEIGMGRKSDELWQPRIIDIDIILYENEIINLPHLVIPHPHLAQRRFALIPLNEIIPGFIHPVLHKSISRMLLECTDNGRVEKYLTKPRHDAQA